MLEGASDVPVVREVFVRRFGMVENHDFRLHPHQGKGTLHADPLHKPTVMQRGLLDQLPAKLRGMAHYPSDTCVLVLLDVDDDDCEILLNTLKVGLLTKLPRRPPTVEFRLAIEEIESWLIADTQAVKSAFPRAKLGGLKSVDPDERIGAWEFLAKALGSRPDSTTGADKFAWAAQIAPHLNLDDAPSPSFRRFIAAIERLCAQHTEKA
jgi:Domain of unknown function (DUF4276)